MPCIPHTQPPLQPSKIFQVGIFVADLQRHRTIDEGTYALLGAASFLGGSMRLTMSACVMLLELTNNLALLPLIMVVLLVSKVRPGQEESAAMKQPPSLAAFQIGSAVFPPL